MPANSDSFCVERLETRRLLTAAVPLFASENITNESPTAGIDFAGSIWFTAGRLDGHTLYRSDGTREGTVSTAASLPTLQQAYISWDLGPVIAGGKMFLITDRNDGSSNINVTDGTTAGTRTINTTARAVQYNHSWAAANGSKIYFPSKDTSNQMRLWESDGTDAGTKPISPVASGVYEIVIAGFVGSDVYYYQSFNNGGTALVRLSGSTATTLASTSGAELHPLNASQSIFAGSSNNGPRLWVTDGTSSGTRPIDVGIKYVGGLSVLNNVAYFVGQASNGASGLYRTDGTRTGTYALVQGTSSTDNAAAGINTAFFAGRLYFAGYGNLRVINPDGTFATLNVTTSSGDFYAEGDRLWLTTLSNYVTADQPLLVRAADAGYGGIPTASTNGRFLFIGPLYGSTTQLYAWDENSAQSGYVSGYLNSDLNANSNLDTGEPKLTGTDVFIDLNSNGVFDAGIDPKYTTTSNGYFEFSNVPVGTWTVAPVAVPGVIAASVTQTVTVTPGFSVYGLNVLASTHARLAGLVFNDVNLNGQRDSGEAGLSGVKVFVSADPNATQPASGDLVVTTDSSGQYLFTNLDGVHGYVCVQPPSDRYKVAATNFSLDPTIPAGTIGLFAGPTVAVKVPNSVRVSYVIDSNGDGVVDASDATSSTFRVLIHADLDQDGLVGTNEPYSFLANNGTISNLPAGNQIVRVIPPQGWTTSLPGNVLSFDVRSGTVPTLPTFTLKPISIANPSLSGQASTDADFNGSASPGDAPAPLLLLWDDLNGDGSRQTNEAYSYTTSDGRYAFGPLPSGTHRIMLGTEAGTLAAGANNFTATISTTPTVQDLSLYPTARATRVSGFVYLDANKNGVLDATDTPQRGVAITNAGTSVWNGGVQTDNTGRFLAYGTVGAHKPQLQTLNGYAQVNTISPVTLTAGGTSDGFALLIRATSSTVAPLGVISGVVYQDLNFNGQRDTGESGLAGVKVAIDLNRDGYIAPTDPIVTTAADGTYTLPAEPQDFYNLVLTYPTSTYVSTSFEGNTLSVVLVSADQTVNIGAAVGSPIAGTIRDDHNRNGVVDEFDNLAQNIRVWADVDNNGQFNPAVDLYTYTNAFGSYRITRVPPSQSVNIYADAYGTRTLAQSATTVAPAATPGTTRNLPTLLVTTPTAVIAGRVYYDADRSGSLDANELRSMQTLTLRNASTNAIVATQASEYGAYYATFNNLAPGTYRLAAEYTGVNLLQNAGGVLITVGPGDVSSDSLFGFANYSANFQGRVLMDTAHDGANGNDVPIAGVRAFIDVNSNGLYDDGDFAGISGSDGVFNINNVFIENRTPYFGDLIVENPSGTLLVSPYRMPITAIGNGNSVVSVGDFVFATPSGTYAAGYVYEDRNTNGVRDPGEPGLRKVEVGNTFTSSYPDAVLTDREGYFVYKPSNAQVPSVTLGTGLNNTWLSTDWNYSAQKTVTFVNGTASVDFGFVNWRLGGYAFTDSNGNGKFDAGETPIAGKRVWIDSNLNNTYDAGELTATSAADGFWSFTNVGGGSYHIMQDAAAGFVTASRDVTLGETKAQGGLDLASRPENVPPVNTPTAVSRVTFDDGSIQRSMVRSITVKIDGNVTAGGIGAGAFSLVQNSGTIAAYVLTVQSVTPVNAGTVITLIPSGSGMANGSIANGQYTLSIDGSKIVDSAGQQIDAAANGVAGSVRTVSLFRLRSDADGNGAVNFNDFLALQNAFGSTTGAPSYLPGLDTDANGTIDFNDFLNLQNDFGLSV